MKETLELLNTPLDISDIDFRVQSINNGGYATILAYKDARVDMNRLDDCVGIGYWQRDYKVIDGRLYCGVAVYNEDISEWIWKWDVGTESMTEKEKGQASDAFKRACFNLGIGRELYDYPVINVKLNDNEWTKDGGRPKQTFNLKIREWRWYSEFTDGRISFLAAKDENGKLRFKWGEMKPKAEEPDYKPAAQSVEVEEVQYQQDESNVDGLLKKVADAEPVAPVQSERDLLAIEYKTIFGKMPHGRMSIESIRKEIDERLNKIEELEEEEEEDTITQAPEMYEEILMIESYYDPAEFIQFAKEAVARYQDIVSAEEIDNFKALCNAHYVKISKK
jgi:hypothetical protein